MNGAGRSGSRAWFLVAPALAVFCIFALLPIFQAVLLSLFSWRGEGTGPSFALLGNHVEVFTDGVFWRAVLRNFELAFLSLAVQIPIALLLAVLLAGRIRGRSIFRTAYFAPMVVPTVVIAFFWRYFLLDPEDGLANALLGLFGSSGSDWLHNPRLAFGAVFSAISWRYIGFHTVILLAGALGVPGELYDAAKVDGAGAWACFRHVTLPGMRGAVAVSALLAVIGSLRYFDLIYIITGGGPDHPTELGATGIYTTGNVGRRWGDGCALAVVLLLLSMGAAWAVLAARKSALEVAEKRPVAPTRERA